MSIYTDPDPTYNFQVRLVNGSNAAEGRVEVLYDRTWGSICEDEWSIEDAHVACRMLGFPSALSVTDGGSFGEGDGPIWLSDVACSGNETSLLNCNSTKWNTSDCDHSQDVGVICNAPGKWIKTYIYVISINCIIDSYILHKIHCTNIYSILHAALMY